MKTFISDTKSLAADTYAFVFSVCSKLSDTNIVNETCF